jgi:hypothetical protein
MSSNSGEEYDPDRDKATEDQDDEEEEALDESSASELEQPKVAKKPKKKPGRGQLQIAVRPRKASTFRIWMTGTQNARLVTVERTCKCRTKLGTQTGSDIVTCPTNSRRRRRQARDSMATGSKDHWSKCSLKTTLRRSEMFRCHVMNSL